MGVTYIAIAPDHPLAKRAAQKNPAILDFIESCQAMSTTEAEMATIEKRGIATPFVAKHPITGEDLPVWIVTLF